MSDYYIDFEYILSRDKTYYAVICCVVYDYDKDVTHSFDCRRDCSELRHYLSALDTSQARFLGYAITNAEIPVLCQIMHRDWVISTKWIDLWTEYKMIAMTHPKHFSSKTGLSACIESFGLQSNYLSDKNNVRNVILYNEVERKKAEDQRLTRLETNDFSYSDKEYVDIVTYCRDDVLILPQIAEKIADISKRYCIKSHERESRGEHCKFAGISAYYHNGYPMDTEKLVKIFNNIPKIKQSLQENCNKETGFDVYQKMFKGPVNKKEFSHFQFNMKNFSEYLKSKNIFDTWEKTKVGLRLDAEYLDEMLSRYKDILEPLYNARNTIKQLNSTDLSKLLTDKGYIKSESWPYNQKTSRTSPKPKNGFILNLTPWLRMLIRPAPGRAFVGIDYKSQEVLIAAALAQDDNMLDDYLTDIYIGQAVKTGFAPAGSTKVTHKTLRDGFKPIVLGVNFGMREESLSIRFYNMFKLLGQEQTMQKCLFHAKKFLAAHERAYKKYYAFLKRNFSMIKLRGYYKTYDNWYYFTDKNTRDTQLQNVPCQSHGAAMTRLAYDECIRSGIDVISLHDALYFECAENDAERLSKIVSAKMCDASNKMLSEIAGFSYAHMTTETKIYTHNQPYYDARGESIYRFIMRELDIECAEKFKKPNEIANIHLL